jgi:hypothetical protein
MGLRLKDKNTLLLSEEACTSLKTGLVDDCWVLSQVSIQNDEIDVCLKETMMSFLELKELKNHLKQILNHEILTKQKVVLIKNYIHYDLYDDFMLFHFHIFSNKVNQFYTLRFELDEIEMAFKHIEKFLNTYS